MQVVSKTGLLRQVVEHLRKGQAKTGARKVLKQMDQMILTCICRTLSEFLPKELCKENLRDLSVSVIWDWG